MDRVPMVFLLFTNINTNTHATALHWGITVQYWNNLG